jgi:hypothetical protein
MLYNQNTMTDPQAFDLYASNVVAQPHVNALRYVLPPDYYKDGARMLRCSNPKTSQVIHPTKPVYGLLKTPLSFRFFHYNDPMSIAYEAIILPIELHRQNWCAQRDSNPRMTTLIRRALYQLAIGANW